MAQDEKTDVVLVTSSRSIRFAGAFASDISCETPAKTYKRQLSEDQMVVSCGSCGSYWGEQCIL